MAKNKKSIKKKTQGLTLKEKIAGNLFEEIIRTLLKRYEESPEHEAMSFEEYCNKLIALSRDKRGAVQKGVNNA